MNKFKYFKSNNNNILQNPIKSWNLKTFHIFKYHADFNVLNFLVFLSNPVWSFLSAPPAFAGTQRAGRWVVSKAMPKSLQNHVSRKGRERGTHYCITFQILLHYNITMHTICHWDLLLFHLNKEKTRKQSS